MNKKRNEEIYFMKFIYMEQIGSKVTRYFLENMDGEKFVWEMHFDCLSGKIPKIEQRLQLEQGTCFRCKARVKINEENYSDDYDEEYITELKNLRVIVDEL